MTRKNILFAAGCSLIFLAACQSPKDQIVRKWQMDKIESPTADSMMKLREKAIDTMTTFDSSMVMYFHTTNLDSIKLLMKKEMQTYKEQQEASAKQGSMNFRKDGIIIFEGGGNADSLKWQLIEEKKLVLSAIDPSKGPAQMDTFIVDKLTSSDLRLKLEKGTNKVFFNLKPAGEKKAEKAEEKK
jgi:hypothetical protein